MSDADEPSAVQRTRALDTVQRVHTRYQVEVVESLNICPFARRSRQQGRVHRPVYLCETDPIDAPKVATDLHKLISAHDDAEIVLLTFACGARHPFWETNNFDAYLGDLREAWEALKGHAPWYMVSFHPRFEVHDEARLTRDALVPLLRRSPDPVIQCVNARTLDRVRREAQAVAHKRMVEHLKAHQPELVALFERSIPTDHELSADVAQHNFDHYAHGEGRARLRACLDDIHADRTRSYAQLSPTLALGWGD